MINSGSPRPEQMGSSVHTEVQVLSHPKTKFGRFKLWGSSVITSRQCIERENEGSVDEVRDGEEDDKKCCGVASKPLVSAEYQ